MQRIGAALLACVIAQALAGAQPRRDETPLYEPIPPVRCEAFSAPGTGPGRARLDIHCWLRPSVLVFTRTAGDTSATPFEATAEFALEVYDSAGTSHYRKFVRRRITAATSDAAGLPDAPVTLSGSAELPFGPYVVTLEVTDVESARRVTRRQEIRLGGVHDASPRLSGLAWLSSVSLPESDFFGTIVPVGRSVTGRLFADAPASARVAYRLWRLRPGAKDESFVVADTLAADPTAAVPVPDTLTGCRYLPGEARTDGMRSFTLPSLSDTLPPGSYRFEAAFLEGSPDGALRQGFSIAWPGMPRSLQSLRAAVRPLEYLLAPAEFAALRDLDAPAQRDAFERFWRGRAGSAGTARNEIMGEFYRRVDAAAAEFATIRNADGAMTPRGKYYILYGPPTTRERILGTAAAPREVWTWASTNRSLIFIDEKRTGDYILATEQ
jgi:GWxTD domain-containing protein